MFAFVTFFISLIILSLIMFSTKVQRKTRRTVRDWWNNYSWETLNERPKWPVWFILTSCIVSLIPVVNLIYTTFVIFWFIRQYNDVPYNDEGGSLVMERLIFSNKFTDWLTKEI